MNHFIAFLSSLAGCKSGGGLGGGNNNSPGDLSSHVKRYPMNPFSNDIFNCI